jgi:hypothetical protein
MYSLRRGEGRNAYKTSVNELKGNSALGRPNCISEVNIKNVLDKWSGVNV